MDKRVIKMNSILKSMLIAVLRIFIFLLLNKLYLVLFPEGLDIESEYLILTIILITSYLVIIRFFLPTYPKLIDRKSPYPFGIVIIMSAFSVAFLNGLIYNITKGYMRVEVGNSHFEIIKGNPNTYLVLALLVMPILEELVYRKIIIDTLIKDYNKWTSLIISTVLFSISHLNFVYGIYYFYLGLILGYIYIISESVKNSILAHMIFNLFFYFLNSYIDMKNFYISLGAYIIFAFSIYQYQKWTKYKLMRERGY